MPLRFIKAVCYYFSCIATHQFIVIDNYLPTVTIIHRNNKIFEARAGLEPTTLSL